MSTTSQDFDAIERELRGALYEVDAMTATLKAGIDLGQCPLCGSPLGDAHGITCEAVDIDV